MSLPVAELGSGGRHGRAEAARLLSECQAFLEAAGSPAAGTLWLALGRQVPPPRPWVVLRRSRGQGVWGR